MSNMQKPASATAKEKKLMLFPGDPLIKVLKPDYYIIVEPGTLDVVTATSTTVANAVPDDPENEPDDTFINILKAPSLSDISLVSKKMITDKNKNQFVEFVFNVKNSGGDTVVGVVGIGQ